MPAPLESWTDLGERILKETERNNKRLKNAVLHYARLDQPKMAVTPKDVVWHRDKVELWRYRSDKRTVATPLLLVHSLVNRSYIFDLRPGNSMIEALLDRGFDVYLIDWGVPDAADARNVLETYACDYLPEIVDEVCSIAASKNVSMLGYCFGGVLSLLYAAANPTNRLRSLVALATPVDANHLPESYQRASSKTFSVDTLLDDHGNVSGEFIGSTIRALTPTADFAAKVNFFNNLWNDEFVAAHNAMTAWGNDQIPFPRETFRQMNEMLVGGNAFMNDSVELNGQRVSLSDITVPFLNVYGKRDHIVPYQATKELNSLVGSEINETLALDAGHVGLFVGRTAHRTGVPGIADWIARYSKMVR
ncbi:MAG: alpha/beta fold hydrolase [Acidimicrobiales bacterium]